MSDLNAEGARPLATCGVCDWTLQGGDFEAVKAEAYQHWETAHPEEWADWLQAQRNAQYFLTGEPCNGRNAVTPLERLIEIRTIVDEQANDEGLWFMAETAPEAYLQQALRRLHAAIEESA
jgi:hypothetical protein